MMMIITIIQILMIIIPVTLSIGSISQEQLNDVVSPRSTMLGTDTLKLLRLSGPNNINVNVNVGATLLHGCLCENER